MEALEPFRQEVNSLDNQIIELLARRFKICQRVGHFKKERGIPMMQSDRVEQVKQRCAALGASHGINEDFTVELYTLIIEEACRLEDVIIQDGS